jgi:glutamyl-Q tRNA(Asp) synthetase
MIVTRFAPSPTGHLHLGHALAAITACESGDDFLLRIEDIDQGRSRDGFIEAIFFDLKWLGLSWDEPVLRQSRRLGAYRAALEQLEAQGLIYPCFCTRKEIAEEIARAKHAPHSDSMAAMRPGDSMAATRPGDSMAAARPGDSMAATRPGDSMAAAQPGSNGPLYPGTCRTLSESERASRIAAGESYALRLDAHKAANLLGPLTFTEHGHVHPVDPHRFGDLVIGRKDMPTSYHLAVVVDDAFQNVTLVTRGEDLLASTHIQRVLQTLLGLSAPAYAHHRLVLDEDGRKFSKRDGAVTLAALRERGATPSDIRAQLGL